jgi:hypothetical protein
MSCVPDGTVTVPDAGLPEASPLPPFAITLVDRF